MITKDGITSNCEQLRNEQYFYDPMAAGQAGTGNGQAAMPVKPLKTMIRSLETLESQNNQGKGSNNFFKIGIGSSLYSSSNDDNQQFGWGPEV